MTEPVDPAGLFTPPKGVRVTPAPHLAVVLINTGTQHSRTNTLLIRDAAEELGVPCRSLGLREAQNEFGEHARATDGLLVVRYPSTQRRPTVISLPTSHAREIIRRVLRDGS